MLPAYHPPEYNKHPEEDFGKKSKRQVKLKLGILAVKKSKICYYYNYINVFRHLYFSIICVMNIIFSEFQNVTVTTNAEIYQVCLRLILRL